MNLDIPQIGSVWSEDPWPDRDFSQTVVGATEKDITYESGSGDRVTVSHNLFFKMFPFRCKEFEDLPGPST